MNLSAEFSAQAAKAWAEAVAWRHGPRLSILIFHRVLPLPDPLFPTEVCAARFDLMMARVAKVFNVLPLLEAVSLLKQGLLPKRTLVITFDDGYADNEQIALPILQRYSVPATFFVASGFLDGGRMWNDTVIECVRLTSHQSLDLHELGLYDVPLRTVAERRAAIDKLIPSIKYRDLNDRDAILKALHKACGNPELPESLMMSSEQVRSLHTAGMEIGAHTVNHPILSQISDEKARGELAHSRAALQQLTQAPVVSFAYPNGQPGTDYEQRHVDMVRDLGFHLALTTSKGVSDASNDVFQLPRFTPWDAQLWKWTARLLLNLRNERFNVA